MGRSSVLIILLVVLFLFPIPVLADIAPPDWPPGANLAPESENTQVRMVSEIVVIDVQENIPEGSLGEAKVKASFIMHNLGSDIETMFARFPLTFWDGYSSTSSSFPEIKDVEFVVGGEPVDWRRVDIPIEDGGTVPWAEFGVTFPPGQDVLIDYFQQTVLTEPAPRLLSPLDGEMVPDNPPLLKWDPVGIKPSYEIEIDADQDFIEPVITGETIATTFTPDAKLVGGEYFWRVRAYKVDWTSDWSEVWSFKVGWRVSLPIICSQCQIISPVRGEIEDLR